MCNWRDTMLLNYYQILGVSPNCTPNEVKRAYWDKAQIYHPDVSKVANATELFQRLNEAQATLSDPIKKEEYDKKLIEQQRKQARQTESFTREIQRRILVVNQEIKSIEIELRSLEREKRGCEEAQNKIQVNCTERGKIFLKQKNIELARNGKCMLLDLSSTRLLCALFPSIQSKIVQKYTREQREIEATYDHEVQNLCQEAEDRIKDRVDRVAEIAQQIDILQQKRTKLLSTRENLYQALSRLQQSNYNQSSMHYGARR